MALTSEGSVIYFCFKQRRRADLRFMRAARKAFDVLQVADDPDEEKYRREKISLWVSWHLPQSLWS